MACLQWHFCTTFHENPSVNWDVPMCACGVIHLRSKTSSSQTFWRLLSCLNSFLPTHLLTYPFEFLNSVTVAAQSEAWVLSGRRRDRGFEPRLGQGCLSLVPLFCVVLCRCRPCTSSSRPTVCRKTGHETTALIYTQMFLTKNSVVVVGQGDCCRVRCAQVVALHPRSLNTPSIYTNNGRFLL
jgi:hypothetical protein